MLSLVDFNKFKIELKYLNGNVKMGDLNIFTNHVSNDMSVALEKYVKE